LKISENATIEAGVSTHLNRKQLIQSL